MGGGGPPHNEKPCHPAKFDGHSCSGKADNKIMSRGTVFKSSRLVALRLMVKEM